MLASGHFTPSLCAGFLLGAVAILATRSVMLFFFLALPGIIAHELAHWVVAFLLRASPSSFLLFPRRAADGNWVLGSVGFVPHWFTAGFIGLAPGYLLPLLSLELFLKAGAWDALGQAVAGYGISTLGWAALPSLTDWRIAMRYPLGSAVLVLGLYGILRMAFAHTI